MSLLRNALVRRVLRVPLFYKIMIANLVIVVAVTLVGAVVTPRLFAADRVESVLVFAFLGGVAVVVANAVILRLALRPLEELESAAAQVGAGDLTMRAESSALADREMEQLITTFNSMLDAIVDARARQRELSMRALRAAEEERKRVATDLHDKTSQTLAGLLVQLSLLKGIQDAGTRAALLKETSEQAATAMDEVYRVVQALRPPALELLGLRGAIEAYARTLAEENDVAIHVDAEDVRGALNGESEIATYRIVQEALSNVVRHSQATHATVCLRRAPDGLVVTIEDNGVGFATVETLRGSRSLGLFGMQERASYLGGNVEIRSGRTGTTVEVKIPVNEVI